MTVEPNAPGVAVGAPSGPPVPRRAPPIGRATTTLVVVAAVIVLLPSGAGLPIPIAAPTSAAMPPLTHPGGPATGRSPALVPDVVAVPGAGPAGRTVVLAGNNFLGASTYEVDWDGGPIPCGAGPSGGGPEVSSEAGVVACRLTIPVGGGGPHQLEVRDGAGDRATTTYTILPSMALSTPDARAGSSVTVTGSGLSPRLEASVELGPGGTPLCSSVSRASGQFACTFTVGPAFGGRHTVSLGGAVGNLTILPVVRLGAASEAVGSWGQAAGDGFAPDAWVDVELDRTAQPLCGSVTGPSGAFRCAYRVPSAPLGPLTVRASDGRGASAVGTLQVGPDVWLSGASAAVGDRVLAEGSGFPSGASVVVQWDGSALSSCSGGRTIATLQGDWSCAFLVPPTTSGPHLVRAIGPGVGSVPTTSLEVVPRLEVAPERASPGVPIVVVGAGFGRAGAVEVTWSPGGAALCSAELRLGSFSCEFLSPAEAPGSYTITAVEESAPSAVASARFTLLAAAPISTSPPAPVGVRPLLAPQLTLSRTSGLVGTSVVANATGMLASTAIVVRWNSSANVCSGTTTILGGFACTFSIPTTVQGGHTVTASDGVNAPTALITILPSLAISSSSTGSVGSSVSVAGAGYAPSSSVTFRFDSATVAQSSCASNAVGAFGGCTFTVPAAVAGSHVVSATDSSTNANNNSVTYVVLPAVTLSVASGPIGTNASASVTGFSANASVSLDWSPGPILLCTAASGSTGGGSCSFGVPSASAGSYLLTAFDPASNAATTSFTVTVATLSLSPTSALPGTTVGLNGAGYAPGATYTYCLATNGTAACASGSTFVATGAGAIPGLVGLTTPSVRAGGYDVVVSSGSSIVDASAGLAVFTDLLAAATASRTTTDVGLNVSFHSNSTGGIAPYSHYLWSFGDGGNATTTSVNVSHAYAASGTFTVNLTVVDHVGNAASTLITVVVHGRPIAATPSPTRSSADIGQSVVFATSASLGTTPYASFTWAGLPAGCAASSGATVSCTVSTAGTYLVSVTVTDALGVTSTASAGVSYTVYSDPTVSLPAAGRTSADVGQSVVFSVSASLGSGGYAYVWSGLPTSCAGVGASFTCTPSAAGGATISVTVTDSNGVSVTSGQLAFTVYSDPTASAPSTTRPSADVGQSTNFSTTAALGSGGYTYVWSGLPSGCTGATALLVCRPIASGTYTVSVTVTDSNGWSVTNGTLRFVVSADPTVTVPTANRSSADVGQSITFTAVTTPGSGGLSYAWSGLPTGCRSSNATASCTPSGSGSVNVTLTITDSNQFAVTSGPLGFTVYPDPTVGTPSVTPGAIDAGQNATIAVSATSGSGGISYLWTGLPGGCAGASATVVCSAIASGNYAISVTVTDSNGFSVTSPLGNLTVEPDPTVSVPSANRTSTDVGLAVTFQATAALGSGSYVAFRWTGLPPGCAGGSTTVQCSPTAAGNFTISVAVTDSFGVTEVSAGTLSFPVVRDPSASLLPPSVASADVGQAVLFSASVADGVGPYSFSWFGLPTGCAGSGSTAYCGALADNGTFHVGVAVTDTNGYRSLSAARSFAVFADPILSSTNASRRSLDLGQSTNLSVTASLGSGGNGFVWSGLPQGCSGNGSSVHCSPTAVGTYAILVRVTDSNGVPATSPDTVVLHVFADPIAGAPGASPSALDAGQNLTLLAAPSLGSGGYGFRWSGLPSGCASALARVSCVASVPGTYSVSVSVNDTNGIAVVSPATTVVVAPDLSPPELHLPASLIAGELGQFSVNVTGGTGPWSVTWAYGDGSTGPGPSSDHVYRSPGTYTITVWVNDSAGASVHATTAFVVEPPPPRGAQSVPGWLFGVLIAALGAVGVLGFLVVRRRRPSRRSAREPEAGPAVPTEADGLGTLAGRSGPEGPTEPEPPVNMEAPPDAEAPPIAAPLPSASEPVSPEPEPTIAEPSPPPIVDATVPSPEPPPTVDAPPRRPRLPPIPIPAIESLLTDLETELASIAPVERTDTAPETSSDRPSRRKRPPSDRADDSPDRS